jgi:hypothetical protein
MTNPKEDHLDKTRLIPTVGRTSSRHKTTTNLSSGNNGDTTKKNDRQDKQERTQIRMSSPNVRCGRQKRKYMVYGQVEATISPKENHREKNDGFPRLTERVLVPRKY